MCRHAAYVGPGIAVNEVMRDVDHSLYHQSFRPRELLTGVVCADGFAVGWYDTDTRPEPARYASVLPIWNDKNLPSFGGLIHSGLVMGAVRNATVEGSVDAANCAPFASGRFLFSLNGYLEDFSDSWEEEMEREWIDPGRRRAVLGTTDTEHIFQMVLSREEVGLATAVQSVMRELLARGDEEGLDVQLNLLVADGDQVVATRGGNMERQNSLYHLQDGHEFPGGHLVASEPLYDDPLWEPVDEGTVLVLRAGAPPVRLKV